MSWNNTCNASPFNPPKLSSCGTICGNPDISCIAPLTRIYWSLNASFHPKLPVTFLISADFVSPCDCISTTLPGATTKLSADPGAALVIAVISNISNFSESIASRSEEHTSELQSRGHLVCRLLLDTQIHKHKI